MNLKTNGLAVIMSAGATLLLSSGSSSLQAADASTNRWETSAAASVTLTRGNSESFLGTVSLDTKRKWERDEATFGISAGYGESQVEVDGEKITQKNNEFVKGFGQYNRLFTDRFYGGLRLDGEYDGIAGIDYRFKVSPLAGYYLIKDEKMTLAVEAGPSAIMEKLEGEDADTYLAARFAERFEYKITPTTRVWQSVEYLPQIDRWTENYLINFEAGIDTAISKKWSLRVVFQDNYQSEPAPGKKENDMRLLAGTAYKF